MSTYKPILFFVCIHMYISIFFGSHTSTLNQIRFYSAKKTPHKMPLKSDLWLNFKLIMAIAAPFCIL